MNTLRSLYWESTRMTRFLTIILTLLAAIGVYFRRNSVAGDLHLVFHIASWWIWALGLVIVAVHRYWCLWRSAVCRHDCLETIPGIFVCVLAICIWSTFLASAAVATDFGLALMLLVCDFIEVWLLSRHLEQIKVRKRVTK